MAQLLHQPGAGRAEDAGGVGLVHQEHRPAAPAGVGQVREGRQVAAHREHRVSGKEHVADFARIRRRLSFARCRALAFGA